MSMQEKQNPLERLAAAAAAREGSEARARLQKLFDEGSFVEIDRLFCDEVAAGYGTVDGLPAYAYAQEHAVCCGAVGRAQAAKIRKLYELALQSGAPVVAVFDSDGAKLAEGLDAMDAIADILLLSNNLSGVVPQVAVVAGPCVGSAALIAANTDVVIAVEGADYYLNAGDKAAKAAVTAADVDAAIEQARVLLGLLPSNNLSGPLALEAADTAAGACTDAVTAVDAVADEGTAVAFYPDNACVTKLARVGGVPCGLVALTGDKISCCEASAVARFVRLCDSYSLPVVTFVDAAGFQCIKGAAKLSHAYAEATTAKITVLAGRAYGPVYIAAAGRSAGADAVLAWPQAVVSPLAPEAAVSILWRDRLASMDDPAADRAKLAQEYAETEGSPLAAAENGAVTDVCLPEETRARLTAYLDMLVGKRVSRLPKKHSNMPL